MRKFNIDFNKTLKPVLIAYTAIFVIGIIWSVIFGVKLDINFSGGTKISYSYTGEISSAKIEEATKKVIDKSFTVTQSTSLAGDTQTFEIALVGKNAISAELQDKLTSALTTEFKVNKRELVADSLSALGFCVLAILLGSKKTVTLRDLSLRVVLLRDIEIIFLKNFLKLTPFWVLAVYTT